MKAFLTQTSLPPCRGCINCGKTALVTSKKVGDQQVITPVRKAFTEDYIINTLNEMSWLGSGPFRDLIKDWLSCVLHVGGVASFYIIKMVVTHVKGILDSPDDPRIKAYKLLQYIGSDTFGVLTCSCVPPILTWWACMGYFSLKGYKDAESAMNHYLKGQGRALLLDIPRLLREDTGVKGRIEALIRIAGSPEGRFEFPDMVPVRQSDYKSENWKYALGNIDVVTYKILDAHAGKVEIGVDDPYEWHPDLAREIPCLHTAMENLKHHGARDFSQRGKDIVTLSI